MNRVIVLGLVALLAVAGSAGADVVHLKNGHQIEGDVTESAGKLVVKMKRGTVTLDKSEVARVEVKPSTLDEYRERLAKLAPDDVEGRFELAVWLDEKDHGLDAKKAYEAVLEIDPHHRGAHHSLGHVRYDGKWMTEDEMMTAQGYVRYEGRWVTTEEAELYARDAATKAAVAKLQEQVTTLVRAMASPSASRRDRAYRKLVTVAHEWKSPELVEKAGQVKAWYDEAYRILAERQMVLTEVRATMATLKRPIPTFTTSLGAFSSPVSIQLPELSVVSIGTTVNIPAGR